MAALQNLVLVLLFGLPPLAAISFPRNTPPEIRRAVLAMTTRQLAAQLVVIPIYGDNPSSARREFQDYARLVGRTGVGGLILLNRMQGGVVRQAEPFALATFLNRMQKLARVPLIVGGDFERGSSMRVLNTTRFPHAMAYGAANDLEATRKTGAATAMESRALGVHWVFAPVADVNNNPDNPVINTRSFGERADLVTAHVKAFIEGAHSVRRNGILVTVKHFPGHGDTAVDTHLGLARVSADKARLNDVELAPFRAAIASGVDGVMTGHLAVPAIEDRDIPATLSNKVLTGLLRKDLGFDGLIVTDAMDMQGLKGQFPSGEAAVRAIEAGADVLLVPANADAAIQAMAAAIQTGRLKRDRLERSVIKLLLAKHRLGLFQSRLVNLENLSEQIDSPEYTQLAQSIAEQALSTIKADANVFPLKDPSSACLVTLAENRQSNSGKRMIEEALTRAPNMRTYWLDPTLKPADLSATASKLNDCSTIVIGAFVSIPPAYASFLSEVSSIGRPFVLCALGSPYMLRSFGKANAQIATYSSTVTSEAALIRGLFGEVPMRAKPPVTISEND